jgi:ribonuclease P protein component
MFGMLNAVGSSRLGLTVTRKVGHAVTRNRAKRMLREVFRRHRQTLVPACDLVINVRPALLDRPLQRLEREFLDCFARLSAMLASRPGSDERSTR